MVEKIRLGVNIDHVATLRNARGTVYPDPLKAAEICNLSQADSITIHLREDRRHIRDDDVIAIVKNSRLPVNLEMAVTQEMIDIACSIKPYAVCLVPEKRNEITTEGGLDVLAQFEKVKQAVTVLKKTSIRCSLFINPDIEQILAAKETGATCIEIHTGHYGDSINVQERQAEYQRIVEAVKFASSIGLEVHAGHGLHFDNVTSIAKIDEIAELNIGHSIIAHAIFDGLLMSINKMYQTINEAAFH